MNNRIIITSLLISLITFIFVMVYPVTSIQVPYPKSGTVTCANSTFITTFSKPLSISSNAIIGPNYTYYYSDIIIISGKTCRIKPKISRTELELYPGP